MSNDNDFESEETWSLRRAIRDHIITSGRHLQAVGVDPNDPEPAFVYTIGNHLHAVPELIVIGNYPVPIVATLLNDVSRQLIVRGSAFNDGILDIGWSTPIKVRTCGDFVKFKYTCQASHYYGNDDYAVQQILLPDKEGKFAGDKGVHPAFEVPQL